MYTVTGNYVTDHYLDLCNFFLFPRCVNSMLSFKVNIWNNKNAALRNCPIMTGDIIILRKALISFTFDDPCSK